MKQTEFLIVGQGICGSFLSWFLHKANRSFVVIDDGHTGASSRVAAGVINPVTGRRVVHTWMIDTLLPFALESYGALGKAIGAPLIEQRNTVDFFPNVQMKLAFEKKLQEHTPYISKPGREDLYLPFFRYELGYGEIDPCYVVSLQLLIQRWRSVLQAGGNLLEAKWDRSDLEVSASGVRYHDLQAEKIIFCEGTAALNNPWFGKLPFALNKGEALIIRNEELPQDRIFKKAMMLVPLGNHLFWAGPSYEWDYTDELPSVQFREKTVSYLSAWLRSPFRVEAHLAAVRPATVERRPFAGMHPHQPRVGILNGMGTKGCSLAPYFAAQLTDHLIRNTPLLAEADINRFRRILT